MGSIQLSFCGHFQVIIRRYEMGKLTKAKIDEITRLRQEGYTQKEIAKKAKVHLRTVRKYDPLRT